MSIYQDSVCMLTLGVGARRPSIQVSFMPCLRGLGAILHTPASTRTTSPHQCVGFILDCVTTTHTQPSSMGMLPLIASTSWPFRATIICSPTPWITFDSGFDACALPRVPILNSHLVDLGTMLATLPFPLGRFHHIIILLLLWACWWLWNAQRWWH